MNLSPDMMMKLMSSMNGGGGSPMQGLFGGGNQNLGAMQGLFGNMSGGSPFGGMNGNNANNNNSGATNGANAQSNNAPSGNSGDNSQSNTSNGGNNATGGHSNPMQSLFSNPMLMNMLSCQQGGGGIMNILSGMNGGANGMNSGNNGGMNNFVNMFGGNNQQNSAPKEDTPLNEALYETMQNKKKNT